MGAAFMDFRKWGVEPNTSLRYDRVRKTDLYFPRNGRLFNGKRVSSLSRNLSDRHIGRHVFNFAKRISIWIYAPSTDFPDDRLLYFVCACSTNPAETEKDASTKGGGATRYA